MSIVLITGASGLIGSEATRFFADQGFDVVGVDNDLRRYFFGEDGSTAWRRKMLESTVRGYRHVDADIRDQAAMERVFASYAGAIALVIHAAAQPSHDWAAREPVTDFTVNANGTLVVLEMVRRHCPDAPFIFTSTNKVYGDTPNRLPLVELETRWSVDEGHPFSRHGIDETMSIDASMHSVFGASKVAADVMVQEYGRYFGLKTACFRGGCLTGPGHSGAELHGFLSYLVKCAVTGRPYTVFGYKGKQVRDNIHSYDLVNAFWHFYRAPRSGEVYNIGGGPASNCSMLEAIAIVEGLTGRPLQWSYSDTNRAGDHIWWVSDIRRFAAHYPEWALSVLAPANHRGDPRRHDRASVGFPEPLMPLEVRSLAEWEADGVPGLLSVVIPAHDEEGRIAATVRDLYRALSAATIPHEILVVNDNSRDRTEQVLDELRREVPTLRYINNTPPNGFGFAVRAGLAAFKGEAIVIVMADASDSPDDVVAYYRAMQEGYDCVFGSRFVKGAQVVDYPWPKLVMNRMANFFIRVLFWMSYNDVTNAFKLYRRSVVAGVQPLLAYHFNLTVELPLKSIVRGYRYTVIPTSWYNRTSGVSKFRIREMGSRYLFIVLYCYLEKYLSREDYRKRTDLRDKQLQVWSR